ncbi:hypothetical protein Dimus_035538 [Dionaea muscipula]
MPAGRVSPSRKEPSTSKEVEFRSGAEILSRLKSGAESDLRVLEEEVGEGACSGCGGWGHKEDWCNPKKVYQRCGKEGHRAEWCGPVLGAPKARGLEVAQARKDLGVRGGRASGRTVVHLADGNIPTSQRFAVLDDGEDLEAHEKRQIDMGADLQQVFHDRGLEYIGNAFVEFYRMLMGRAFLPAEQLQHVVIAEGAVLPSLASCELDCDFTREDVRLALDAIADDKALGIDGNTAAFLKKSWSVTGDDVCRAVLDFFSKAEFLFCLFWGAVVVLRGLLLESVVEHWYDILTSALEFEAAEG